MFVNFNKAFNSKPETKISIPPALIQHLNKSLPSDMEYIVNDDGNCAVTSKSGNFNIGGFIFKITESQRKILGTNFTNEDLFQYFYNSQKPIPLELEKDGYILLNGKEFPIEKLNYNPYVPIKHVKGKFMMYPPKFSNSFIIKVGNEKFERELEVTRIPNESVSAVAYESKRDNALYVKYIIDNEEPNFSFTISFDLSKARNVEDIVESTSIYNSFVDNRGRIFETIIKANEKSNARKFDERSILFWEKVLKIEKILAVRFIPTKEDIDFETICLVERLYQNLVNNIPVRDNQTIDAINGEWNFKKSKEEIKNSIGHPIFFEFEATNDIELFGVKINLPCLIEVFDSILSGFEINDGKHKIILSDVSEDKNRYTSMLCFKNEKELKEFKEKDVNERTNLFKQAKKPQEFLDV